MVDFIMKLICLVFHPIIMPILGVLFYFSKSPRYLPTEIIQAKIFSVSILTIVLPVLLYFLLKITNRVESFDLQKTKERLIPLLLNAVITLLILFRVFTPNDIIELFYYFSASLISYLICFVLVLFNIKASIHMLAASGFLMFAVLLGITYKININGSIALMVIILGALATARLHLKAHTGPEIIIGTLVGMIPQGILLVNGL